jgi:hypothetical protein
MLIESRVIIQEPDGTRRVASPEEAKEYPIPCLWKEENYMNPFHRNARSKNWGNYFP